MTHKVANRCSSRPYLVIKSHQPIGHQSKCQDRQSHFAQRRPREHDLKLACVLLALGPEHDGAPSRPRPGRQKVKSGHNESAYRGPASGWRP